MKKDKEMSNSEEIIRLSVQMDNMKEDVDKMKDQLDEIRMMLTYFKGNWKGMAFLYAFLLGVGALAMRFYQVMGK